VEEVWLPRKHHGVPDSPFVCFELVFANNIEKLKTVFGITTTNNLKMEEEQAPETF
jgi:hypothetical protein